MSESDAEIQNDTFMKLPLELLIEIFSHLDRFKDLQNCMLLSKEINELIFTTPKLMRKICYRIWEKQVDAYEYIFEKGVSIRHLDFKEFDESFVNTKAFLHQMPNLETLNIRVFISSNDSRSNYPEDLNLNDNPILPNLRELRIGRAVPKKVYDDFILDLICQQKYLKYLHIEHSAFPSRDISTEVKFKLKTLTFYGNDIYIEKNTNLYKFIETQAESLKILDISRFVIHTKLMLLIFYKLKNLEKLLICSVFGSFRKRFHFRSELKNLKYFFDKGAGCVQIDSTTCPSIEYIDCYQIEQINGIFNNLHTLKVGHFSCSDFGNTVFPNLKYLKFKTIDPYIVFPEPRKINYDELRSGWKTFVNNNPNIEHIRICDIDRDDKHIFKIILGSTKAFKNLKTFEINKVERRICHVEEGSKFYIKNSTYKIEICSYNKSVRTSYCIAKMNECRKYYRYLKRNYRGYRFIY